MIAALAFSLVAVALGFPGLAVLAFGATNAPMDVTRTRSGTPVLNLAVGL
jgi:hypothetical protein